MNAVLSSHSIRSDLNIPDSDVFFICLPRLLLRRNPQCRQHRSPSTSCFQGLPPKQHKQQVDNEHPAAGIESMDHQPTAIVKRQVDRLFKSDRSRAASSHAV